ncbi:type II restriction endonuclease [Pseudomonas sp. NPDC012596]|uniref:type II restriction endonuclease n=1 Tax=Pseudomonas sp. NPDC012596 TaxID=3364419 RepID=UPI00367A968E
MERLNQHFTGVAAKYFSKVDATRNSNQHEIGSNAFSQILGHPGHNTMVLAGSFFYFCDDSEEPLRALGTLSWYDARRHNPNRSAELRLYYPENIVTARMTEGDFCIVAVKPDRSVMVIVASAGSTAERQLRWLFDIDVVNDSRFKVHDVGAQRQVSLIEELILAELGVESRQDNDNWLDSIIGRFGETFPTTAEFSHFARETCPEQFDLAQDSDAALMGWMVHEEMLFRTFERSIVQQQLDSGFRDVDHFISVSLSVQNRRKSRVGYALEHHLAAVFSGNKLLFGRQVVTEKKSTADFLFPGGQAYHNPAYPDESLVMLASKSTCKDRWRQVLAEADRILRKHLFTLEPAISSHQTDEMQHHHVQLVVPEAVRGSYTAAQQGWIMNLSEYIGFVRDTVKR